MPTIASWYFEALSDPVLAEKYGADPDQITEETSFFVDDLDSLDIVELVMELEEWDGSP